MTLLVAHGSRNPAAATAHEALCVAVGERAGAPVRPAYLELTTPSIADAVDAAVADGATRVRVVPHFLGPGNHVLVDIPTIVEAARERHASVEIELAEHLGADPALVELLAARVLA